MVKLTAPESLQTRKARYQARYYATPEGKAASRKAQARYYATPEGKARRATPEYKSRHNAYRQKRNGHLLPEVFGDVEIILEMQGGRCLVCKKRLAVVKAARDHDHETGEFRGFVHGTCNRGISLLPREALRGSPAGDYLDLADTHYWHEQMLRVQKELKRKGN